MGNRLTRNTDTYAYDAANRLTKYNSQTQNYFYDANGNTTSGGGRTNTWDSQNRLVECTYNGTTSYFTYGSDGLRRRMVVGANTTDYVIDGQNVVRELVNGAVSATYLTGPRGVEYRRDEVTDEIRWYLYDGLGSVIGEADENGNVTATRKYDVYGAVRGSSGSSASNHKFVGQLGHATETDTGGLIYMRARWYDPSVGRFISEDPAEDGNNWYAYCGNNPINAVDPTGEVFLGELDYDIVAVKGGFLALAGVLAIIAGYQASQLIEIGKINLTLSSRQVSNEDAARAARELGLTQKEAQELHREISKKGYTSEEMWETARDILARRDPLGRRGGKPKR